jgi:hypothetical protein
MRRDFVIAVSLVLVVTGASAAAQDKPNKEEREAMAMTPSEVVTRVEVKGQTDPLEPSIWVSTQPFLKARAGNDRFLRANISKATGQVFYQLYVSAAFSQSMRFNRMTYLVGGELRSADVERVFFDVSCQRYGCTHFEDYVIELPRADLDALAADPSDVAWRARFFGQSVDGTDLMVLRNETAGFLTVVDHVIEQIQAPSAGIQNPPTSGSSASLR